MTPFPHRYSAVATATDSGDVTLTSGPSIDLLRSDSPPEFGGPRDRWSPETLLVAAVADCVILTFRSIARSANVSYRYLTCSAQGTLDRADRVTRFTALSVQLQVAIDDLNLAPDVRRLAERAERLCLITNSLNATSTFHVEVVTPSADAEGTVSHVAHAV